MFKNISVVTPVYNDWESFVILANDLSDLAVKFDLKINLIAVNDGSIKQFDNSELNSLNLNEIKILKLVCNLGHQRAIAIGLVEAYSYQDTDGVIVLDCDGEDKVVDVGDEGEDDYDSAVSSEYDKLRRDIAGGESPVMRPDDF